MTEKRDPILDAMRENRRLDEAARAGTYRAARARTYTAEQAEQMQLDTGIGLRLTADEDGRTISRYAATVKAPAWSDDDPRFYMDHEWLDWFADTYPEWTVDDMADSGDDALSWVVWVDRRPRR